MSILIPGLRAASQLRQAASSSISIVLLPPHQPRPLSLARRYASTSTSTKSKAGTVQSAQEEIAARNAQARTAPGGVDLLSMTTPIFEPVVDPPFSIRFLFRKGIYSYVMERLTRYRANWSYLNEMIMKHYVIPLYKPRTLWVAWTPPMWHIKPLLNQLQETYESYNNATAQRDLSTLRSISTGAAFQAGKQVATAKDGSVMKWELISSKPPKLISARVGPLDMLGEAHAAQLVAKFDSEQLLTIQRGRKITKRQQRVVEHYVFERMVPVSRPWMIKEKFQPRLPDFFNNDPKKQ